MGTTCQEDCPSNLWGPGCDKLCNCLEPCDGVTGNCTVGCMSGKMGTTCQEDMPTSVSWSGLSPHAAAGLAVAVMFVVNAALVSVLWRLRSSFRCISWKRSDKDGAVPDNNGNINPDISENTEAVYEDIEANEYEHLKSKPYFKRSERGGTDPADNENTYCVTAENTERVYTTLAENVYYENVK